MKTDFNKKTKSGSLIVLVFFGILFSHTLLAQKIFTWNGSVSSEWSTPANWNVSGSGGTSTYPGENALTDRAVINDCTLLSPIISTTVPNAIENLRVTNNVSLVSILTINTGATLTVTSTANNPVVLNGGSILNNGVLDIKTTYASTEITAGISCGTPPTLPGVGSNGFGSFYGYSGSGELKIDISTATVNNSSVINVTGLSDNTTYSFLFDGATNFKLCLVLLYVDHFFVKNQV